MLRNFIISLFWKRLLGLSMIGGILYSCGPVQKEKSYDTRATEILDSLSNTIGKLESCSYTLNTIIVERNTDGELVEKKAEHDVYMRGPNKMYIYSSGTNGNFAYWYNGTILAYYSYDRNEYDTINAPENIITAIDYLHDKYKINFPAADFFYPTLTDDIIENYNKLIYWGNEEDKALHIISAHNENLTVQVWIDSISMLPDKFKMLKEGDLVRQQYDASFTNCKLNPKLPDLLFEFSPPADAVKITLPQKK